MIMNLNATAPSTASGILEGGLTVNCGGPSTMTLLATNTYSGPTTVTGGTLLVDGGIAAGAVTVESGATLGGNGTIGGPTTIQSGATLEAGSASAVGMLGVLDLLTLNPGSYTTLRIDAATAANDVVAGPIVITYGGTLTVKNLAGTLALGDSFQLFSASSYSGNFAATDLPALPAGLAWNWTPTNGTLAVVTAAASGPAFTGAPTLTGASFTMSFTGTSGNGYTVLMTTNLTVPLADWTALTSGTFGANPVNFTDTGATNAARFYRIKSP